MKINYNSNPQDARQYDTQRLRDEFLTEDLFQADSVQIVYTHIDRLVILGVSPTTRELTLDEFIDKKAFGTDFFLQRRELGIINLGGAAVIETNQESFELGNQDALYIGLGKENIRFRSLDTQNPAQFYCLSAPAHHAYEAKIIRKQDANKIELGSKANANERLLTQYLHPDLVDTCQLCMGITHLKEGSVWNTMPAHTHERRMEAYLYFNVDPSQVVFHFMGEPSQTRHIVVQDKQLVLSPSWSIHSGCGTKNYSFIWGMVGENQTFDDMDFIEMPNLK